MLAQHRAKRVLKPLVFADEVRLRRIRHGPAKGVRMFLNRRTDLQREFGLYENELNRLFRRHVGAGSVVYDIGAADGFSTLTFASLALEGHVYAFEPAADIASAFRRNVRANPQLSSRVTLVEGAVGSGALGLDAFAAVNEPPNFVKIDVDGGELEVLASMTSLLGRCGLALVVETHSRALEQAAFEFLRKEGHIVRIVPNARWRLLYPELRPIEQNRWLLSQHPE